MRIVKNYNAERIFLVGDKTYLNSYIDSLNVQELEEKEKIEEYSLEDIYQENELIQRIDRIDRITFGSEENLQISQVLSPYNNIEVKSKNRVYPSLITYLLSLRLCYNTEISKLIETNDPREMRKIMKKNAEPCKKIFLKFSSQYNIATPGVFVKNAFQSVDEFLVDKTNKGLDVLYNIVPKSAIMKQYLLSTGNKTIVFHDPDTLLGDGLDGSGLNLYGKRLTEIRKMLRSVKQTVALSDQFLNNLINFTDVASLSPFEKWAYNKIETVAKVSGMFFQYLCEPRTGFLQISSLASIIAPYEKDKLLVLSNDKSVDNFFLGIQKDEEQIHNKKEAAKKKKTPFVRITERVTGYLQEGEEIPRNGWKTSLTRLAEVKNYIKSLSVVNPILNGEMATYVIHDLFNCNIVNSVSNISFPQITPSLISQIKILIKSGISNQYLKNMTEISDQACNNIYIYVLSLAEYIIINSIDKNNKDLIQLTKDTENFLNQNKRDFEFYGFNDDDENAVAQAILYIVVALTDWLDLDYATMTEFKFVEKLLYFNDNKEPINLLENPDSVIVKKLLTKMFYEKGIIVYNQDMDYLSKLLYTIQENMKNNKQLENKVFFYANFI